MEDKNIMDNFNGEEVLLGMMALNKMSREAPWAIKEHDLPKGYWRRVINPDGEAFCNIVTERYVIGVKTVSIPRGLYSGDVFCTYSDDGKTLTIPAYKYDYDKQQYIYYKCEYETENYSLLSKTEIKREEVDRW